MSKKENSIVYTYRYIWKNQDNKLCVKFVCGQEAEHKAFMGKLLQSDEVVTATRIYVNEINVNMIEQHEFIKKEKK